MKTNKKLFSASLSLRSWKEFLFVFILSKKITYLTLCRWNAVWNFSSIHHTLHTWRGLKVLLFCDCFQLLSSCNENLCDRIVQTMENFFSRESFYIYAYMNMKSFYSILYYSRKIYKYKQSPLLSVCYAVLLCNSMSMWL